MGKEQLLKATKATPFPDYFARPTKPDDLKMLQKPDEAYSRWMATRTKNPFVSSSDATGFEGYFVGTEDDPAVVVMEIAKMGAKILENTRLIHSNNPNYMNKVWQVANGEVVDTKILAELNACLIASIARLRMKVLPEKNPVGDAFRREISDLMRGERIEYKGEKIVTAHIISVPKERSGRLVVTLDLFKNDHRLISGYEFMRQLGKFGYPLLVRSLQKHPELY